MGGQFDSVEQLIEYINRHPLQGSNLFRDKTDEWDDQWADRRPGDSCGNKPISSYFSSSGIPNQSGQINFMQIVCKNCGKPVGIGVRSYCDDCVCPIYYTTSSYGTFSSITEHIKGSNIHCSKCQEYQSQQLYPWGGNTPIMPDEKTCTNMPIAHELGTNSACTVCKKFNESKQITADNLKGGFKAASGKAMFDLIPVHIFRELINNNLTTEEREKYGTLITELLDFWENDNVIRLNDSLHSAFELLADLAGSNTQAMFEIGQLYAIGAQKYSKRNWEKGIDWGIVWSAAMRHLLNHIKGELNDPVDGQLHLTSVCWNIIALIHFTSDPDKYKQFDSRDEVIVAENKGQK